MEEKLKKVGEDLNKLLSSMNPLCRITLYFGKNGYSKDICVLDKSSRIYKIEIENLTKETITL